MPEQKHIPVMLDQSIDLLNVRAGRLYIDATAGFGGHLEAIIKQCGSAGQFVAIDRDQTALSQLKEKFADCHPASKISLVHNNYSEIKAVVNELGYDTVSGGILADLGVSSMQIDQPDRGFSFLQDGPLDMRMDRSQTLTAHEIINTYNEGDLADILYIYAEERASRQIARRIIANRPINSTGELARIVASAQAKFSDGQNWRHKSGHQSHPATRTFQALRIAVNEELSHLTKFLNDAVTLLEPGARIVVITFHSLEDRLVKQIFKEKSVQCICPPRMPICICHHQAELRILTRKPIVADNDEVLANTRSRSAKLRAGEKIDLAEGNR